MPTILHLLHVNLEHMWHLTNYHVLHVLKDTGVLQMQWLHQYSVSMEHIRMKPANLYAIVVQLATPALLLKTLQSHAVVLSTAQRVSAFALRVLQDTSMWLFKSTFPYFFLSALHLVLFSEIDQPS